MSDWQVYLTGWTCVVWPCNVFERILYISLIWIKNQSTKIIEQNKTKQNKPKQKTVYADVYIVHNQANIYISLNCLKYIQFKKYNT